MGRVACHCETEKYLSRAPAKENFVPFIFIKSGQERIDQIGMPSGGSPFFSEKLKGNYRARAVWDLVEGKKLVQPDTDKNTRRFLSGPENNQAIASK